MTKKLIVSMFITLDGYISGTDGDLKWFEFNRDADEDSFEFLDTVSTVIMGRKTYELFAQFWPTATTDDDIVADRFNALKKVVVSRTLKEAPWGEKEKVEIISEGIEDKITELKQGAGKDLVIFGGASLAQSVIKMGLVDEYRLIVCPIVLGKGVPFFSDDLNRSELELTEYKVFDSGMVRLNYKSK